MDSKFPITKAFQAADEAWSAELVRCFGKHAGDKRYLPEGKGAPGSVLRLTHDARDALRQAFEYVCSDSARGAAAR